MRWNLDIENQIPVLELDVTNGTASHHLFPSIRVTGTALSVGHLRTTLSGRRRVVWVERQAWDSLANLILFILRIEVSLRAMKATLIRLGRPAIPIAMMVMVVVVYDMVVLLVGGVFRKMIGGCRVVIVVVGGCWGVIRDCTRLVVVRIVLAISHWEYSKKELETKDRERQLTTRR